MGVRHDHWCDDCHTRWLPCYCPFPGKHRNLCDPCWKRREEGDTRSYERALKDAGYERKNIDEKLARR
jgi:hypothetical protein